MMNTSISRRQFLKASGLAAAGACAAGLLTGCGGSSSGSASGAASSGSGSSYTILYDSQPATLNYLTTGTDLEIDRKSTRLNSSHANESRMPSSA